MTTKRSGKGLAKIDSSDLGEVLDLWYGYHKAVQQTQPELPTSQRTLPDQKPTNASWGIL